MSIMQGIANDYLEVDFPGLLLAAELGNDSNVAYIQTALGNEGEMFLNQHNSEGNTILIVSVIHKKSNVIKALLDFNPNKSIVNNDGFTAFTFALANDSFNCAIALYEDKKGLDERIGKKQFTPLMWATRSDNHEVVTRLIQLGADVNQSSGSHEETPLMFAARKGLQSLVNNLLSYSNIDVNLINKEGNTAFMCAVKANQTECAKAIYEGRGGDINLLMSIQGNTPLMWAIKENRPDIVEMLLLQGAEVNHTTGKLEETPLISAATSGFIDIVNILREHPNVNINQTNKEGNTAFMCAVKAKHIECAAAIYIDKKKEIDEKIGTDQYTPLLWAIREKRVDLVELLLEQGADIDRPCGWNNTTPLIRAAADESDRIVEILMEKNANVTLTNDLDSNVLMIACERIYPSIVRLLLGYERIISEINRQNKLGYTALILAVEKYTPIIQIEDKVYLEDILLLLSQVKGINFELKTHAGKTAFVMAAEFGSLFCVKILKEKGADINSKSKIDKSALTLAAVKGHLDIVEYLLTLPNLEINDVDFQYAIRGKNRTIVEIILMALFLQKRTDEYKLKMIMNGLFISAEKGQLRIFQYLREIMNDTTIIKHTPKGSDYLLKTSDGETVLYTAAKHGQLSIIVHIFNEFKISIDFTPQNLLRDGMPEIIDVLAKFFVDNEQTFITNYVNEISKNNLNTLKMLPILLVKLKSPTVILNQCFETLLGEIRKFDQKELLFALVIVACALNECVRVHYLESSDLQVRLDILLKMIEECMDTPSMDLQENVMQVLQDPYFQSKVGKESHKITMARSFEAGPLVYCMRYDLHSVLGIEQISKYIKAVFETFLCYSSVRPTHTIGDIFQIRSKFFFIRSCPLAMLVLEGISKIVMFVLIFLTIRENKNYYNGDYIFPTIYEKLLLCWIAGNCLHEIGEFFQVYNHSFIEYFSEIWNVLDTVCNALLICWAGSLKNNPDVAFLLLAISAVPTSLCLLRYLSASKNVGVLVLTIFAVLFELWNFLLVLILIIAGFGVALFGLISDKFTDFGNIVARLFYYSLAGEDLSTDYGVKNTGYVIVGKILLVLFVVLTMIVLMNLVIAKLTATYDAFQKSSLQRWSMMKARQTKEFLLIRESNPLSMLPPPLNLITSAFILFHYCHIYWNKIAAIISCKSANKNSGNVSSTNSVISVSISGTVSDFILRIFYIMSILGPGYETYLCLNDIYKQSKSSQSQLIKCILAFPFVFLIYIAVLFYNAFRLTKVRNIPDSTSAEICGYGRKVALQYPDYDITVDKKDSIRHTVHIKCLRFESILLKKEQDEQSQPPTQTQSPLTEDYNEVEDVLISRPSREKSNNVVYFPRSRHYVRIIYRDQILTTKTVEVKDFVVSASLWYDKKDFFIYDGEESIVVELWEKFDSIHFSDVIIGRRVFPMRRWIANGRFEGKINLTSNKNGRIGEDRSTIIGSVVLVVTRMHFRKDSIQYNQDQIKRNKIKNQGTAVALFTDDDKKKIFRD